MLSNGFDEDTYDLPDDHEPETPDPGEGLPFSLAGVDLLNPPGFVGRVARWIEAQSRRPRLTISVASALTAIGNIGGLRYTDDQDRVTTNLFTLCIAGSRTGKESMQQAVGEIHRAVGMAPATHGSIKSEQEIVRNLTRHQAALYVIDEIGILLQKIKNAQAKGGAAYLDGVIGMLMAAYSKADGFMLLTGDAKDDLRKALSQELSAVKRRLDEGEDKPHILRRADDLERALDNLDNGLERPFLSMIGFTTPVTFDDLVDYQSATNGFIGRALLFNERDTAPRSKAAFRKAPMSDGLRMALIQIATGGEYAPDDVGGRVEYYGQRTAIPTTPEASEMLAQALDWMEDRAIDHKGKTGLEALYLGAYELVSKVSLILALQEGQRTADHVRWAFAMVRRDVEQKMRLVASNVDGSDMALFAKIANVIDGGGETIGVIYNRLRSWKRPSVDSALAKMQASGMVRQVVSKHPVNGKTIVTFHLQDG